MFRYVPRNVFARLLFFVSALMLTSLVIGDRLIAAASTPTSAAPLITALVPQVIAEYPHDPDAFTQGLLLHDGYLYESTGQRGESTLRKVEIETGEVIQSIAVGEIYFAEGLERVEDRLIQLTWQEQTAFIYDLETFSQLGTFTYEGEGWGLCYDGDSLYMSDGSSRLTQRDPDTFEIIAEIPVTIESQSVPRLNELECVGDDIYANVWQTNFIVRIDKDTGNINGVIDASQLLTEAEQAALPPNGVLNGIAFDPDTGHFYITGKLWSRMFEVEFTPR